MAARKNKINHNEQTKRRIQASQLLNRLYLFAIGKVIMKPAQVLAAKVVIGKSIPDLKAIEHTGKDMDTVQRHITVEFVRPGESLKQRPEAQ
jgi:hypothetical protein